MGVRVRYSPSPTGTQHMGSARTALFNWLYARHHGGTLVLRIEDTDQARSRPEHVENLCRTMRWLGLDWDEGPEVGGPHAPYHQMGRLTSYRAALDALVLRDSAYPCYCSPAELQQRRVEARRAGLPPRYDGRCAHLSPEQRASLESSGVRPAWRLRVPSEGETVVQDLVRGRVAFANRTLDDFVLMRPDGVPTYNFAVVVDDAEMKITHVLRADEHLANTPKQLLVCAALGWTPPHFGHLPMVLAADRSKLSKRHGAVAIEEFREMGLLPEAVVNYCALLGWSPADGREILTLNELRDVFDLDRVGASAAVYDITKLLWLNAQHLRRLDAIEVVRRATPWLQQAGLPDVDAAERYRLVAATSLVQERIQTLADLPAAVAYFFGDPDAYDPAGVRKFFGPGTAALLHLAADRVESLEPFGESELEAAYRRLAEDQGVKPAVFIHPTRLALTGRTVGPSLFALAAGLGRGVCVRRLRAAAGWIAARAIPAEDAGG